jgi:2-methylisocitrate lyase-like PEP mutase family enzyme
MWYRNLSFLSSSPFLGPSNIRRSVTEYIRAGIAGFHIEDQTQQKRCGHLANKQLVSTSTFITRIRAAASARAAAQSDIVLIARTDALASLGYDEALARLRAAHEAGADVLFLEGITSKAMCAAIVKDLAPLPVLVNMVEKGATPLLSVDEAREIGF